MLPYLKQAERAQRYLERLRNIYKGTYTPGSSEFYEDELVSFFIHCYHIRDWIINLSKLPITAKDIDAFINSHNELKICADFCNGEKHCHLERSKRTGGQPHLAYREYRVTHYTSQSGAPSTYKASYKIISGTQAYDALEIAEKCMELWSEYIAEMQIKYLSQPPANA
uniref:Ypar25 n=1 Tax=Aquipseudomonas alcaligenes TaxID=43263 RepID=Q939E8_AQUAC|nr:Ypar25 [Pseudomonas alcaligenes]